MNKKNEKIEKKGQEKKPELVKKENTFKKKKKIKKNITSGIAYVYSTFNNTIHGHLLVQKVLKDLENQLHTQLK